MWGGLFLFLLWSIPTEESSIGTDFKPLALYSELKSKLHQMGGFASPKMSLQLLDGKGFGLFANENIAEGETILLVPSGVGFDLSWKEVSADFPEWEEIRHRPEVSDGGDFPLYAFYLAWLAKETVTNSSSPHPALWFSPPTCFRGLDALDSIKHYLPHYASGIEYSQQIMLTTYLKLAGDPEFSHFFKLRNMQVTFEEYSWAMCILITRAFSSTEEIISTTGKSILVPILDIFNSAPQKYSNAYWYMDHFRWVSRTKSEILKGEEILVNYGCKDVMDMFLSYGFNYHDDLECEAIDIRGGVISHTSLRPHDGVSIHALRSTCQADLDFLNSIQEPKAPATDSEERVLFLRKKILSLLQTCVSPSSKQEL